MPRTCNGSAGRTTMTREDEAGMDAIMKAFCMYHEADCTVSFNEFTYLVNNCSSYLKYRYASLYGPLSYFLLFISSIEPSGNGHFVCIVSLQSSRTVVSNGVGYM